MKQSKSDLIQIALVMMLIIWALTYVAINRPDTRPMIITISAVTVLAIAGMVVIHSNRQRAIHAEQWANDLRANDVVLRSGIIRRPEPKPIVNIINYPPCIPTRGIYNQVYGSVLGVEIKWIDTDTERHVRQRSRRTWADRFVHAHRTVMEAIAPPLHLVTALTRCDRN